jgi:hypothetical protein
MTASWIAPAVLVLLAVVLAVSFVLMPLDLRRHRERRRRIVPAGLVGGIDEVFHPEAHEARLLWEERVEASQPVPAPGEPPFPDGRIVLDLPPDAGRRDRGSS